MLNGVHFLLTYRCTMECDHCFVYSRPGAKGTFTIDQVKEVLEQAEELGSVESIYFEGGEPFMFYPLILEGLRLAKKMGFRTGVVSNAYWANSVEDAKLWLAPLKELGVSDISISPDRLHFGDDDPLDLVTSAADDLGITVNTICVETPHPIQGEGEPGEDRAASVLLKGRAVDKLTEGLPPVDAGELDECTDEELSDPRRVHVDPFGNVHVCQGLVIGNVWDAPLKDIMNGFDPDGHPIIGPVLKGGPVGLADEYDLNMEEEFCSACHLCFEARRSLIDRFPESLAPRQIYGLE